MRVAARPGVCKQGKTNGCDGFPSNSSIWLELIDQTTLRAIDVIFRHLYRAFYANWKHAVEAQSPAEVCEVPP